MTDEKKNEFINRILLVNKDDKAKYGQMNVFQMICHCADQFRMMFGEIEGLKRQDVNVAELIEMSRRNITVPAPEGLDQVSGGGTKPTELENDKKLLIDYLNRYNECDNNYKFSFHPYFGEINKDQWDRLVISHLNHHLIQFNR
jgi:hypothetical protein